MAKLSDSKKIGHPSKECVLCTCFPKNVTFVIIQNNTD